ncbi:MAG TPA: hypothetical protein DIV79_12415 [Opitutae bacterium]|nr:hypothetical protein [Opitutaceae bacterium]HCR30810.1 hypothetical protein [Opitutae bacterium]
MKNRIQQIARGLYFLSAIAIVTPSVLAQTVDSLFLTTQTEVDASRDVTEVIFDVVIESAPGTADPITNLDGLENLRSVGSTLFISGNHALVDTSGLLNLTDVSTLVVQSYASLTNLDGLTNLAVVENELLIANNGSLERYCGLYALFQTQGVEWDYLVDTGETIHGSFYDDGILSLIGDPCILEEPEEEKPIDPEAWIRGLHEEGVISKWIARSLLYSLKKPSPRIFLLKVSILYRWGILSEELAQPLVDAVSRNEENHKRCWRFYHSSRKAKKIRRSRR